MDFVLWKMSKPGEPSWQSPWGPGRPGWHIECSAMNCKQLGTHFDIHGGGSDLMFPHHENEIAQSSCAHDGPYVNYWMHSGMVMIDKEKMSKSLDNFFTIRDVLGHYDAETVRYFLMSGHYRSQLNYSEENLKQARTALERLYTALRGTDADAAPAGGEAFEARFREAMDDDFNTPEAYSALFDLAREVNRLKGEDMAAANGMAAELRKLANVLGLLQQEPEQFLQGGAQVDDGEVAEIEALIKQRNEARAAKDWALADAARDRLNEMNIVLEDGPQGTTGAASNPAAGKNKKGAEFSAFFYGCGLGFNHDLAAVEFHHLIGDDLAALAGFDFAVDFHPPFGDDFFGGAAAFTPATELQQIAQFDVGMIVQIENFHTALLI